MYVFVLYLVTISSLQMDGNSDDGEIASTAQFLDLFRFPVLRREILIIYFTWFGLLGPHQNILMG